MIVPEDKSQVIILATIVDPILFPCVREIFTKIRVSDRREGSYLHFEVWEAFCTQFSSITN